MIITSFNYGLEAGGWRFAPRCRYVISDSMFRRMTEDLEKQGTANPVATWSVFNSYERRYGGQDLNGRRLAIYRENGFGDNLMVTGLAGYLKHTYPQCTIDVFALPNVAEVWHRNEDANLLDVPPPFDAIKNGYDYHLFFEGMIENDNESDQGNSYDNFLSFAGIFPKSVPDNFKRPQVYWTKEDEFAEKEWNDFRPKEDYFVLHWNPSGLARQYPYEMNRQLARLLTAHGHVVIVGDTAGCAEGPNMPGENRIMDLVGKTKGIRALLPILKSAKAIVCPDSCVLHLAACFPNVPTVALYGAFAHSDRSLYYKNVTPLHAYSACPSAPCRTQRSELPVHRCAQAAGWQEGEKFCRAMYAIQPERAVETVLKLCK